MIIHRNFNLWLSLLKIVNSQIHVYALLSGPSDPFGVNSHFLWSSRQYLVPLPSRSYTWRLAVWLWSGYHSARKINPWARKSKCCVNKRDIKLRMFTVSTNMYQIIHKWWFFLLWGKDNAEISLKMSIMSLKKLCLIVNIMLPCISFVLLTILNFMITIFCI